MPKTAKEVLDKLGITDPIFDVARTTGWVAPWNEMISDPEQKIGRPRQRYTGPAMRDYVPVGER